MTKIYTIMPNQTIKTDPDDVEVVWEETKTITEKSPEPICLRKIKARLQGIADQRASLDNEEVELLNQLKIIEGVVADYKLEGQEEIK